MPRFLLACAFVVGGCFFEADYRGAACSDGKCPSGLTCSANVCVETKRDAAVDGDGPIIDAMPDARPAALTCADPGPFPSAGGMTAGSTASRTSTISSNCNASVMNGADAVYRIDTVAGAQLLVTIAGYSGVAAYVIAPCSVSPATPICLTNTAATPGNPLSLTTAFVGQHFVIVDSANAGASGSYTLTVEVN